MTHEDLKWLIVTMVGCTSTFIAAVVWLATLTFQIGKKYGAVEAVLASLQSAGARLDKSTERLERIPVIENRIEQLAAFFAEDRRRLASELPALQERVTTLWERDNQRQRRESQGQYGE